MSPAPVWWYECDVLPVVGFIRAETAEDAKAAALDDAIDRLRSFLSDGTWKVQQVLSSEEVHGGNASR